MNESNRPMLRNLMMPVTNSYTPTTRALLIAACFGLANIAGCSSTDRTWDPSARDSTSDPVEAYKQRSRAEALALFAEASQLHQDDELDRALAKYRESIEKDNTIFAAWNNMGQLLLGQKNYADAVAAFKIASDLQLDDPRPDYNIGLAYQTIGWGDESLTHFERSLDRDPNYLPALRGAVRSAEMVGRGDQRILGYIRNGQLRETDNQWREYFDRQRFRVEKLIDAST